MKKKVNEFFEKVNLAWFRGVISVFALLLLGLGFFQENSVKVGIHWQTGNQVGLAGFNILRGEQEEGPYNQINQQIIPVSGSGLTGNQYTYIDEDVKSEKAYYYKIESITTNGERNIISQLSETTHNQGQLSYILAGVLICMSIVMMIVIQREKINKEK